ncbi:MAG: hypothetical protein KGQ75_14335 [Sphingomonadales bacterium]|uniref:hypothetical protein n=1 Tax=unclassified Novosphingobium TaxID=2644732 RepID=UPI0006B89A3E|nr:MULTISPECIES: hypothetical protein [unclassified Novosphingobium]KPF87797.1 hypothetical protein IP83_06435 [Novosphingobium sp. AAP93]MBU6395745.1 hypothetical protein [Sphingomonadales bacterium]MBY0392642.1 hypothetical protein [Novosphingobium sp.]
MRKLLLAAVAGTAFALAGCSEKAPEAPATEAAMESTEAAMDASAAPSEDASAPAADASSEAAKM